MVRCAHVNADATFIRNLEEKPLLDGLASSLCTDDGSLSGLDLVIGDNGVFYETIS